MSNEQSLQVFVHCSLFIGITTPLREAVSASSEPPPPEPCASAQGYLSPYVELEGMCLPPLCRTSVSARVVITRCSCGGRWSSSTPHVCPAVPRDDPSYQRIQPCMPGGIHHAQLRLEPMSSVG